MTTVGRVVWAALSLLIVLTTRAAGQCLDWSRDFAPPNGLNGAAAAFQVFDDGSGPALYVGGFFTTAGNQPAKGIARWDGAAWSPLGNGLGGVTCLAVYDDGSGPALYAGGQFRIIGGAPSDYIAKWNASALAWEPVGNGPDRNIASMAVYDDGSGRGPELYVAGSLDIADGRATEKIAAWNGTEWRTWSAGMSTRTRFAMAYDAARQQTVVFGGRNTSGDVLGDTWIWDGSQWTLAATTGPTPRVDAVMTYDPVHQRILLVGGSASPVGLAEMSVWSWDGTQWTQVAAPSTLPARVNFALAYDSGRDRLILHGGRVDVFASSFSDETWEFNGSTWTSAVTANKPRRRIHHGIVYDPIRAKIVLFGGNSSSGINQETWEYTGTTWTQVSSTGPSPRLMHGMTYDTLRNRTVVFGGAQSTGGDATDTWTWNGAAWAQLDAGDSNWPRRYGPMVYDAAHDRIVQRTELGSTWLFNNTSWSLIRAGAFNNEVTALTVHDDGSGPALYACGAFSQVAGEPGRVARWNGGANWEVVDIGPSLIPDNLRCLASADLGQGPRLYMGGSIRWAEPREPRQAGIVQWNGSAWSLLTPDTQGSVYGLSVFDDGAGAALYTAGSVSWPGYDVNGFARWDGTAWSAPGFAAPSARRDAAAAYDPIRRETILYGGAANLTNPPGAFADTWAWNGRNWMSIDVPGAGPGPRFGHAMAFDSANSRILLVGGGSTIAFSDSQTWSWSGAAWSMINGGFGPGRALHAVAFDSARNRLVLFGGLDNSGAVLPGTWEFDGLNWAQVSTIGPSPRHSHAMAYDPIRQRTVLYAGVDASGVHHNDVWEWDGATWINAAGDSGPGLRRPAMVYDSFRQRIIADGGVNAAGDSLSGMRQWDGTSWSSFLYLPRGGRYSHIIAYDDQLHALTSFGGVLRASGELGVVGETWLRISRLPDDNWVPSIEGVQNATAVAGFDDGSGFAIFVGGDFTIAGPSTPSARIAKWGDSCAAPVITDQPDSLTRTYDQLATFTVAAIGAGNLGYQWRHNGVPLTDIPGRYLGSLTSALTIRPGWTVADTGEYDVIVRSPAGDTVSDIANLNVVCAADLTGDSLADFSDYLEFLNLFDAQDPRVDFNQDGFVDFIDYLEFLNLFEIGC